MHDERESSPDPLASLRLADFEPWVGTTFEMSVTDQASVTLTLSHARDRGVDGQDHLVRRPFSLLFRGPKGFGVEQGTYRIEHATLPPLRIFLVPLGIEDECMLFEAAFQ